MIQPFKFIPIFKHTLWGGDKIHRFKNMPATSHCIGESWELSGVEGSESVVAEGPHQGQTINQLVTYYREKLVGKDNYRYFGNEFPLLVKFIDAAKDLSIQVHPDDEKAKKYGFPRGKTEMWYILPSEKDAMLYAGLNRKLTPKQYKEMVENDTICDAISTYRVRKGDCFFIPAGRIHSIGRGCFLLEIQQTSDVTFRIYDFKRQDANGNYRQLHTKEAADCIDFTVENHYRTDYVPAQNQGVQLVHCPHFTSNVYDLTAPITIDCSALDSFVILICTAGEGTITDDNGQTVSIKTGETVLFAATTRQLHIEGTLEIIETYV